MPEAQRPGRRDATGRKSRKPIDGETMIRQYRPLLGAAIALLATGVVAGELTLYEGENFQGRNLTLRSDMRDLDRTQFNDRAMSLVIRDGVWEVCSDAQFRGHCATLRPGNYPVLHGGLNRRISSGRMISERYPYSAPPAWDRG